MSDAPKFTAACVQMRSGREPLANRDAAVALVGEAADAGAHYVQTPEMTSLVERSKASLFEKVTAQDDDPTLAALRDVARARGIVIQIGSLAVRNGDKVANRAFLIDAEGAITASYDKLHLYDVDLPNGETYRESATVRPGDGASVADTPWGRLGLTICYDIRFPALYRALAEAGATVLTAPACFTKQTGEAHWHVLHRARAIETELPDWLAADVAIVWFAWYRLRERVGVWAPVLVGVVAAGFLWTQPVGDGIRFAQVNAFLVLACLLDLQRPRQRWLMTVPPGVLVGLAMAIKLTPGVFVIHYLVGKRWREAGWAIGTATFVSLAAWFLLPQASFAFWGGALSDPTRLGPNEGSANQAFRATLLRRGLDGPELLLEPNQHPAANAYTAALVADGIPAASFAVDDVAATYAQLVAGGVRFTQEPTPMGPVVTAVLDDTCGNLIQLTSPA